MPPRCVFARQSRRCPGVGSASRCWRLSWHPEAGPRRQIVPTFDQSRDRAVGYSLDQPMSAQLVVPPKARPWLGAGRAAWWWLGDRGSPEARGRSVRASLAARLQGFQGRSPPPVATHRRNLRGRCCCRTSWLANAGAPSGWTKRSLSLDPYRRRRHQRPRQRTLLNTNSASRLGGYRGMISRKRRRHPPGCSSPAVRPV